MHFLCLALVKQLMREGIGDVNTVIKAKQLGYLHIVYVMEQFRI